MAGVYVLLGLVVAALLWLVLTYNALVYMRQHVRESWSGIDTELKRRYDLIPNLVETVKGYASHEREVLQAVTEARSRAIASTGTPSSQARDENALIERLQRLMVVVEHYPALKASRHFLHLQRELANTEDRIQAARRFYNANVRDLNNRVQVVPSNIVASLFGFGPEEFFEIDDAREKANPPVQMP